MIRISLIYYQVWNNQLYHVLKINNRASDRLETINSQIEPIPLFVIGVVGKIVKLEPTPLSKFTQARYSAD